MHHLQNVSENPLIIGGLPVVTSCMHVGCQMHNKVCIQNNENCHLISLQTRQHSAHSIQSWQRRSYSATSSCLKPNLSWACATCQETCCKWKFEGRTCQCHGTTGEGTSDGSLLFFLLLLLIFLWNTNTRQRKRQRQHCSPLLPKRIHR